MTATDDTDILSLDAQLCFALVTAARNVVAIYRPILEPLGLTHPQYLVMLALWESSPRSLRELADALAFDAATASPLVKRLEAQGLVTRRRAGEDERRLEIVLTAAGVALRERALAVPPAVMSTVGMSVEQVRDLRESLRPFAGSRVPLDS
ncbi:MarR family winged helix-turn-helix transcriptional regulator [Microbacterium gorillae]|uniref:MarR family winged helix-turn-helix transcriptional regulator n=1 Tax=Microbacterium gorillae TaxID=1231063 RepID=UPI00058D7179|nr:MarR family transcriptional regulator [Microbacterium gorillae]